MQTRMYRSFQGLLLLGLCIFFASKAANGQLTWYINSRLIPLTIFGIIFLAVLAQIIFTEIRRSRKRDEEHGHDHNDDHAPAPVNLWFMLVPLLIGVLIPARPLDSSAFATKGFNTNSPLVSADSSAQIFETESEERNVLDWLKLLVAEDIPLEVLQSKDDKISVPPLVGALLKNEQDLSLFEKLVFMNQRNR